MYKLIIPNAVKKDIRKLPRDLQEHMVKNHLPLLQNNPGKGVYLTGQFRGFLKYSVIHKKTEYRIVYRVNENKEIVVLIMIGSRENFYERLKRRL